MRPVRWSRWIVFVFILMVMDCQSQMGSVSDLLGLFVSDDSPKVISFSPQSGDKLVSPRASISILWDQPMEIQSCVSAFSMEPNVKGNFETTDISLKMIPNQELPPGGYVIRLTKQCENKKGKDLDRVYSIPFQVIEKETFPNPQLDSFLLSTGNSAECMSGGVVLDRMLQEIPSACVSIPGPPSMTLRFSKPMNQVEMQFGLRLDPSVSLQLVWTNPNELQLVLDEALRSQTRYHLILPAGLSATDGSKFLQPIQMDFMTGEGPKPPSVIAFGLASQNCGLGLQELGNLTGARWDSGFCFWSVGLPILSPKDYQFRGGDDGTGSSGVSSACADVTTDNFRVIFDEYVDPISVISSSRLTKISPPSSNIRLSTWEWTHCQTVVPFGCREITYSFAESEASCNGSMFGNNATGGDFNLSHSANAPNDFPYYEFRLDTEVRSVHGKRMLSPFVIQMEAK
ncbi:Ig-like protein [Leptospira sp. WS60.C2]